MNFRDIERQVLLIIGRTTTSTDSDLRAFVRRSINETVQDISTRAQFRFLERESDLVTVGVENTGTLSVTNGSRTVTGSGTSFTADMVGRRFRARTDDIVYEVATQSSGTSITLDREYQGTTGSALTFSIYRDVYALPIDFDHMIVMKERSRAVNLFELSAAEFDSGIPDAENQGTPNMYFIHGQRQFDFTDGTVALTNGSATVTGTSTNWVEPKGTVSGIDDHENRTIVFGSDEETYRVQDIASATSLTLDRTYEGSTSSGTSYTMTGVFKEVQFYPIPDSAFEMELKYYILPAVLGRPTDIPDIPFKYHHVIVAGAQFRVAQFKRPEIAQSYQGTYENGIQTMTRDNEVTSFRLDQLERFANNVRTPFPRVNVRWNTLT